MDAAITFKIVLIAVERPPNAERCLDRSARVILVRDRSPEQRHDSVAEELIDRTLVLVNLGEHQVESSSHQAMDDLRVEPLAERSEARHIHEEHGDLLALALDCTLRDKNLLGEVSRCIRLR